MSHFGIHFPKGVSFLITVKGGRAELCFLPGVTLNANFRIVVEAETAM